LFQVSVDSAGLVLDWGRIDWRSDSVGPAGGKCRWRPASIARNLVRFQADSLVVAPPSGQDAGRAVGQRGAGRARLEHRSLAFVAAPGREGRALPPGTEISLFKQPAQPWRTCLCVALATAV